MTFALISLPFPNYSLWILIIFLVVGFVGLNYGGDFLTEGSVAIASNFHINKAVIGLTVVSMATSMPEMITSLLAAKTSPGLAIGNIIGSNIANVGLILGITALIIPLNVQSRLIKREIPLLIAVTGLFIFFAVGGYQRWEGFVMLSIMVIYLYCIVKWEKRDSARAKELHDGSPIESKQHSNITGFMFISLGVILLAAGADLLVGTSVELATRMGISDVLIGLTIIALGTSLPELAASIAAARAGHQDICVGNIVGSNLFNMLLIGGVVASLIPIPVDKQLFWLELPAMMIIVLVFLWFSKRGGKISRKEGLILLTLYATILTLSSFSQMNNSPS